MDTILFDKSPVNILLRKIFLQRIFNKFNCFFVTGSASKTYLVKLGISNSVIYIFSYIVDIRKFQIQKDRKEIRLNDRVWEAGATTILIVSKLIPRENPIDAIKAFCLLARTDLQLLIIGDGIERLKLQRYAQRFPSLNITFAGHIPYCDLQKYYRKSKVFIHPSKNEPWGVSVQEAICCGCRVICSDKVGSGYDLVIEAENGFRYRSGDYRELAKKIEKALIIPDEMVSTTNEIVLSNWNYHTMWEQICLAAFNSTIS